MERTQHKKESVKEYLADKDGNETLFSIHYEYLREGDNCKIISCEVYPLREHKQTDEELKESVKILLTAPRPGDPDFWTMDCEIEVSQYEYSGPVDVTY
jgi:hypothetical protein